MLNSQFKDICDFSAIEQLAKSKVSRLNKPVSITSVDCSKRVEVARFMQTILDSSTPKAKKKMPNQDPMARFYQCMLMSSVLIVLIGFFIATQTRQVPREMRQFPY